MSANQRHGSGHRAASATSLRCYAALLADSASQLQQQEPRPHVQRAAVSVAIDLLAETADLLHAMSFSLETSRADARALTGELIGELLLSGVLEHWARTLLLARRAGASDDTLAKLQRKLFIFIQRIQPTCGILTKNQDSLSYLLSAHLVQLAAVLDGGTTYGMPARAAPGLLCKDGQLFSRGYPCRSIDTFLAELALCIWRERISEVDWIAGRVNWLDAQFMTQTSLGIFPVMADHGNNVHVVSEGEEEGEEAGSNPGVQRAAAMGKGGGGPARQPTCSYLALMKRENELKEAVRNLRALPRSSAFTVPPFNLPATFNVSMRLAAAATEELRQSASGTAASAAAPAGPCNLRPEAGGQGPGQHRPPQQQQQQQQQAPKESSRDTGQRTQLRRPPQAPLLSDAVSLGLQALLCAREAMWKVGLLSQADTPPCEMAQLRDWWGRVSSFIRLAVGEARSASDTVCSRCESLATLLPLRVPACSSIALRGITAPSADLVVALKHGYLRMAELLLRRSENLQVLLPCRTAGRLASKLVPWTLALCFGRPNETASLLSTVAKLVRNATANAAAMEEWVCAAREVNDMVEAEGCSTPFGGVADDLDQGVNGRFRVLCRAAEQQVRESEGGALATSAYVLSVGAELVQLDAVLDAPSWCSKGCAAAQQGPEAVSHTAQDSAQQQEGPESVGACRSGIGEDLEPAGLGVAAGGDGSGGDAGGEDGNGGSGSGGDVGFCQEGDGYAASFVGAGLGGRVSESETKGGGSGLGEAKIDVVCEHTARLVERLNNKGKVEVTVLHFVAKALTYTLSYVQLMVAAAAVKQLAGKTIGGDSAERLMIKANAWDELLLYDAKLLEQVSLVAYVVDNLICSNKRDFSLLANWKTALRLLAAWMPTRLAVVVASWESGKAWKFVDSARTALHTAAPPGPVQVERGLKYLWSLVGPGGKLGDVGLVREVEAACAAAVAAEAEVAGRGFLDANVATLRNDGAGDEGKCDRVAFLEKWSLVLGCMVTPGEARAALPVCSNPECVRLVGDSEAGQRLLGCGRCGGLVRYCCKECQTAHWKAGHGKDCRRKGDAAAIGSVAAGSSSSSCGGGSGGESAANVVDGGMAVNTVAANQLQEASI
ncbi:hypothetical protein VOLCADRAFT_98593 [Volvox carteri f. nagariensis]|uniref:MYND-type domain-containing protein n=1 Tax=Volvox carteri f. nagariensis TaxID=3068 RepID=D8UFR8_VOLCA|nr:uncharacterized protein VOLCADRAFT_98593 [Volvox carteri f. nagariensis]EFJ41429.1 hypothetical protein VOLCADRAFT_98593 [Volvox carteri f. nagariensis]|eukprot:XP_002957535.1 hypothetical protein VOLCADRAFT_98593 [Volvox carteri f. nagariensis]